MDGHGAAVLAFSTHCAALYSLLTSWRLDCRPLVQNPPPAGYGAAVPEGLCYQWAEDYFRDPTAKEDEEEEETFTPKPYPGMPASKTKAKKPAEKKKTEKKPPEKKMEEKKPANDDQLSFGQMALI